MNDHGQSIYPASVFYLCPFIKFLVLNVVNGLYHWAPNGESFGIHKSFAKPKDLPNISQPTNTSRPNIRPPKMLTNLHKPRAYIRCFRVFCKGLPVSYERGHCFEDKALFLRVMCLICGALLYTKYYNHNH